MYMIHNNSTIKHRELLVYLHKKRSFESQKVNLFYCYNQSMIVKVEWLLVLEMVYGYSSFYIYTFYSAILCNYSTHLLN